MSQRRGPGLVLEGRAGLDHRVAACHVKLREHFIVEVVTTTAAQVPLAKVAERHVLAHGFPRTARYLLLCRVKVLSRQPLGALRQIGLRVVPFVAGRLTQWETKTLQHGANVRPRDATHQGRVRRTFFCRFSASIFVSIFFSVVLARPGPSVVPAWSADGRAAHVSATVCRTRHAIQSSRCAAPMTHATQLQRHGDERLPLTRATSARLLTFTRLPFALCVGRHRQPLVEEVAGEHLKTLSK